MTQPTVTATPWYAVHDNLVLLTRHLADEGYEGDQIASVIEKPWQWEREFRAGWAIAAHENRTGHHILNHGPDQPAYFCAYAEDGCDWEFDVDTGHVTGCDAPKGSGCSCGADAQVAGV